MGQDVGELINGGIASAGDIGRAYGEDGKVGRNPLGAVVCNEGHVVARPDPYGEKPRSYFKDLFPELSVGDGHEGATVPADFERRPATKALDALGNPGWNAPHQASSSVPGHSSTPAASNRKATVFRGKPTTLS